MRKLRTLLAGTAVAGSLVAGLAGTATAASADTAAATTTAGTAATAQAQSSKHYFGPIYSTYGRGEHRGDRSYVKGYWWYSKSEGRYYIDFDLFDRDQDRQYSYADFYYHDDEGWHRYKRFATYGHMGKRIWLDDDVDGFRFRVGEGGSRDYDWSTWYKYGF
ncbi:hypothetical protein Sme01_34750 [Sphaerisporangium melleum]|uniref:Secreted protein n=1 Tax=Sphaerisporangium melleum TaxID=321316 RepID=A0A917R992_9ACTN|nr:hypothetical protein [Sphaerisporangium melleum]GGK96503.1 hypothetical protein GCM10007964_43400 [Sphaerisporangium melleum]GII70999.1 hypothetical protein Sme01_34750 [Sphaerisporangium melleum]